MRFCKNEIQAINIGELYELQRIVYELIRYAIYQGLPLSDEFSDRNFKEYLRLANNAETALLVIYFFITKLTRIVSKVGVASKDFSVWTSRLRGYNIEYSGRAINNMLHSLTWLT